MSMHRFVINAVLVLCVGSFLVAFLSMLDYDQLRGSLLGLADPSHIR
jgi:hypothetical protein